MSITVTLAGNLAEAPELFYTLKGESFVTCRGPGQPARAERRRGVGQRRAHYPRRQDLRLGRTQLHDGFGSCDSIFVHGLERTKSWPDKETYKRRTEDVVVVDNRFGEVGVSLMYVSARVERAARLAQAS